MSTALDFALGYRKLGYSVIPLRPRDKRPLVEWTLFQSRLATTDEIRSWYAREPAAGVGIVGGAVSGGLAILDVDPRHGGMESLQAQGILPDTPCVKTGGGGMHYYFRGATKSRPIAQGLDCKSEGGYVVAPPSIHPDTGQPYVWFPDCSPRVLPLAPAPAWLSAATCAKSGPATTDSTTWITSTLQGVIEGNRDNTCIRLAGYFRSRGIPQDVCATIMARWARDCSPPFEAEMVRKTIESAYSYGPPANGKGLDL